MKNVADIRPPYRLSTISAFSKLGQTLTIDKVAFEKWDWLLSEGLPWVDAAATFENDSAAAIELRRRLNPWQLSMILQQLAFRRRARNRFPNAERWLWTDRSLQQASDWCSAAFKARLIPPNHPVIDACCGAGADLVALASLRLPETLSDDSSRCNSQTSPSEASGLGLSEVVGIERDPLLVRLAEANLAAHHCSNEVLIGEYPDVVHDLQGCWIHVDPDRRPWDHRTTTADSFSPPLHSFISLLESAAGAIVKLAPATVIIENLAREFQRGWIGSAGQCRQQLLIRGVSICEPHTRFAALCDRPLEPLLYSSRPFQSTDVSHELSHYVFECHPVLHAAGLHTAWANQHGLRAIESSNGYFTGDQPIESPWVQAFRVVEILPYDRRKLTRWLREHNAGVVEVKKRLIELDANRCQRELSKPDGEPFSLLVTRLSDRTIAIACKRLSVVDLASESVIG